MINSKTVKPRKQNREWDNRLNIGMFSGFQAFIAAFLVYRLIRAIPSSPMRTEDNLIIYDVMDLMSGELSVTIGALLACLFIAVSMALLVVACCVPRARQGKWFPLSLAVFTVSQIFMAALQYPWSWYGVLFSGLLFGVYLLLALHEFRAIPLRFPRALYWPGLGIGWLGLGLTMAFHSWYFNPMWMVSIAPYLLFLLYAFLCQPKEAVETAPGEETETPEKSEPTENPQALGLRIQLEALEGWKQNGLITEEEWEIKTRALQEGVQAE